MKKIFGFILLITLCLTNTAYAKKNQTMIGTIMGFECGDNCYLTIVDEQGKDHTITHIFLSINISWLASEEWIAFKSLRRILIHKKQKIRHKPWFGCFLHLKSATY